MRTLVLAPALLLAACAGGSDPAPAAPPDARPDVAAALLPAFSERPADAVVIDVRTPPEWAGGTIAGAERVNLLQPDFAGRVEALGIDHDAPVYLYCRSGSRSGRAEAALREAGFTRVVNAGAYSTLVAQGAATEE